MVERIGDGLNPHDKKIYEQQYKHAADLFKRALDEYQKTSDPYKQEAFKDVMDKAMTVLQQTAKELMRSELQKQNDQISKDYATFGKYSGDEDTIEKLNRDLDQAKRFIG